MKRPLVPLFVLFAFFSSGACARSLAITPLNAGITAAGEERWEEAVQYWKKALEQDPGSAAAHNNLAVAYEKRGAFDEAGREYEAGPAARPRERDDQRQLRLLQSPARGRPGTAALRARVLLLATLAMMAGAACRAAAPVLVRVEMPGVSPFPAGSFAEIIVTDFRNGTTLPDFDAGLELQTYLAAELRRAFDGAVSLRSLPAGPGIPPESWREAAAGRNRAVILTGTVRFGSQVRKAVVDKRVPFDSPFNLAGRALIEQLRWTLLVDVAVISGDNGETLYRQDVP